MSSSLIYGVVVPARELFEEMGLLKEAVNAHLKEMSDDGQDMEKLDGEWLDHIKEECAWYLGFTYIDFPYGGLGQMTIISVPSEWKDTVRKNREYGIKDIEVDYNK